VIGMTAATVLLFIAFFLREPKGHMTEVLADGTVQLIEVN
jgi:NNP family nitrate/nitrite transporter-like MFS transporter